MLLSFCNEDWLCDEFFVFEWLRFNDFNFWIWDGLWSGLGVIGGGRFLDRVRWVLVEVFFESNGRRLRLGLGGIFGFFIFLFVLFKVDILVIFVFDLGIVLLLLIFLFIFLLWIIGGLENLGVLWYFGVECFVLFGESLLRLFLDVENIGFLFFWLIFGLEFFWDELFKLFLFLFCIRFWFFFEFDSCNGFILLIFELSMVELFWLLDLFFRILELELWVLLSLLYWLVSFLFLLIGFFGICFGKFGRGGGGDLEVRIELKDCFRLIFFLDIFISLGLMNFFGIFGLIDSFGFLFIEFDLLIFFALLFRFIFLFWLVDLLIGVDFVWLVYGICEGGLGGCLVVGVRGFFGFIGGGGVFLIGRRRLLVVLAE